MTPLYHNFATKNKPSDFFYFNPARARFDNEGKVKSASGYVIQTTSAYPGVATEQTMFVLFVRSNQKLCTISFTNALTQGNFGIILNLIGALYMYQINRFVFLCRMLHFVQYLSNALQLNYFISLLLLESRFGGTAEGTKYILKLKVIKTK